MRFSFSTLLGLTLCTTAVAAHARDLRITIPGRSELTPVQKLNREGVEAIQKHDYEKAEGLFYKAYLYDPADPFTLNNLGYVSELQGQLEHAEKFYKLASEQGCNAIIDRTNEKDLKGKPMMYALDTIKNVPMRINRMNVVGIELLSQDRSFDAEVQLKEALALDPQNPFTLNNLGVAEESIGDYDNALKYYDQAAALHAKDPVVVTLKRTSRGKPVSDVASASADDLRHRMKKMDMQRERADMLMLRGVHALNQNDWNSARQNFLDAYSLDPKSAFALNNLGYVSERDGDPEAAQLYYDRAKKASDAGERVGLATQLTAQGEHLSTIADSTNQKIGDALNAYAQQQHQEEGPVELTPRNGATNGPLPSATPATPAAPANPPDANSPDQDKSAPPANPTAAPAPATPNPQPQQ